MVGLLWMVACLNYLDRLMITTMHDQVKESIPMTDAQFGLLTSVFLWVYGIAGPFAGFLADRLSRRSVILASLLIWSVVTWLTGHAQTFNQLLLTRGVMGVSEACYIPAALALIADFHRQGTRSLATGIHMSGIYTGAALGGVGGYVAQHYGWRVGFNAFGIAGIGYAFVLLLALSDAPREEAQATKPDALTALRVLFGQPAFWLLLIVAALFGAANWSINGWLPTYLKEHFQLGTGKAGLSATGYIQIASFIGVLAGGGWADRWSGTNKRARVLVPAVGFSLAAPCLLLAGSTAWLVAAIVGLIVYGLGRGSFDANLMPALRQTTESYSATGYGFLNMVGCFAGGAMIYAGGLMKDHNVDLSHVFQLSAFALLAAAVALLLIPVNRQAQLPCPL